MPPTTVEEAFAAWRLANPGRVGWPLDAFKAGWAARQLLLEETAATLDEPPPKRAHNLASDFDVVFGPG